MLDGGCGVRSRRQPGEVLQQRLRRRLTGGEGQQHVEQAEAVAAKEAEKVINMYSTNARMITCPDPAYLRYSDAPSRLHRHIRRRRSSGEEV